MQWVSLAGVGITTIGSNGRGDGQFKAPTGVTTYTDYGLDNFAVNVADETRQIVQFFSMDP